MKLLSYLLSYKKVILALALASSLFWLMFAGTKLVGPNGRIKLDTSLEPFFSHDHGDYDLFKATEREFGDENLLFLVVTIPQGRLDLNFLLAFKGLEQELNEKLPHLAKTRSLLNFPSQKGPCVGHSYFYHPFAGAYCEEIFEHYQRQMACFNQAPAAKEAEEDILAGLEQAPDSVPESSLTLACPEGEAQLNPKQLAYQTESLVQSSLERLSADPLIQGELVGKKGEALAIVLKTSATDSQARHQTLDQLEIMVGDWRTQGWEIYYGGQPREEYASAKALIKSLLKVGPWSMVILLLAMWVLYQHSMAPAALLLISFAGCSWAVGFFALWGGQINPVTLVLPPLIATVGTSYVIHFISQYFQVAAHPELSQDQIILKTLERVSLPLGLALLTTLVGFLALLFSPIPAIRDMGLFALVGIFFMAFFTLLLLPCLLPLWPRPQSGERKVGAWDRIFTWSGQLIATSSKGLIYGWLGLALLGSLAAYQVKVDAQTSSLPESSPVRRDRAYIEARFGGTSYLRLILINQKDKVTSAQTLVQLAKLKEWLARFPEQPELKLERLYSPLEYINAERQGLDGLTDEEAVFYLNRLDQRFGVRFLSSDSKQLALTLRLKSLSTGTFLAFRDQLKQELSKEFPGLEHRITGSPVLAAASADQIASSQGISLFLAFLLIALILSFLFFSIKVGLWALAPNLVAVVTFFGMLGLLGVPIGVTLSVIAAIALGIGVDDTIHFILHFKRNLYELKEEREAIQKTLRAVGKPMVYTTLVLAFGFGTLAFSELDGQVTFGLMTAFTLLMALFANLFFLPALLIRTRFVVVWEYLTLRYTPEFISSISLFSSMNIHESKLLTLVADTRDYEDGEIIFRENEPGDDVFVILEGQVEVFFDARFHGQDRPITCLERGQVFGERVLFPKANRMDSARALGKVQLLELNVKNLTDLKTRFPLIAVKLYFNLAQNLCRSILACYRDQDHQAPEQVSEKRDLINALSRIGRKGPSQRKESRLMAYYHRWVVDPINRRRDFAHFDHDTSHFMSLIDQILDSGEISYYQIILIKGFVHSELTLSQSENRQIERLIERIEAGQVQEVRPAFSNAFTDLNPRQISWLRENFEPKNLPSQSKLFVQGEFGGSMILILSGRIETRLETGPGAPKVLSEYGAGDFLAERALFVGQMVRPYSAVALTDTEVIFLSPEGFQKIVKQRKRLAAQLAFNMVGFLATKLRRCILSVYA